MATRTNPWAVGTATIVNGGILALALLFGLGARTHSFPPPPAGSHIDLDYPLFAPANARANDGGSGAGEHDLLDPIRGRVPEHSRQPLAPPQVPLLDNPRLHINSSIAVPLDVKLPDDPALHNIGIFNSPNVTRASNGPGESPGIGSGRNGLYGDGTGNGPWGPGGGPGPSIPGVNGVAAPVPIYTPEAEFSDEARRQKYQGICTLTIVVDAQGNPQDVRVLHPLGMGLDEKAVDAVKRYRFKPGTKNGRPVPTRITVAVNFRLF
jgi:TonB family protein